VLDIAQILERSFVAEAVAPVSPSSSE
jgi:hypothetical protein